MYPQPQPQPEQQQHLLQPYYAPNSWPSDSSLHPPGTEPLPNSNNAAYPPQSAASQNNWIVAYDATTANVASLHEASAVPSSLPSTWNGAWPHQYVANHDATAALPNQTTKSMRCEVCKIDCNSKEVYEKHVLGKKHNKNLQIGPLPPVGNMSESNKGKPSKSGTPADSSKVCTVCNISCNSQEVYNKHLAGKKHVAQVRLMSSNGIGPHIAAFKRQGVGPWQKAAKKIKVSQPAWCDVCKISCNSSDIYIAHLAGKKHLKNLEKLSQPRIDAGAGTTAANASNPMIGPPEKRDTDKAKSQKAPEVDIMAKMQKAVEGGVAAAAVRLCTLCNVVCNSDVVFNDHLSGHKHAAMVKKEVEAKSRGATTG